MLYLFCLNTYTIFRTGYNLAKMYPYFLCGLIVEATTIKGYSIAAFLNWNALFGYMEKL